MFYCYFFHPVTLFCLSILWLRRVLLKTQQVFFPLGVGYTLIIPFQGVPGQGQAFGTWTHTLLGAQVPGSSLLGKDSGSFLLTPVGDLFRACCELTTHNLTLPCNVQVGSKECS